MYLFGTIMNIRFPPFPASKKNSQRNVRRRSPNLPPIKPYHLLRITFLILVFRLRIQLALQMLCLAELRKEGEGVGDAIRQ